MSSEFPGSTSAGSADEAAAKNPAFASALERARQVRRIQGCQIAKFDPFLSLDCARVEGVGGAIQGHLATLYFTHLSGPL